MSYPYRSSIKNPLDERVGLLLEKYNSTLSARGVEVVSALYLGEHVFKIPREASLSKTQNNKPPQSEGLVLLRYIRVPLRPMQ